MVLIYFLSAFNFLIPSVESKSTYEKLLVVSFDGFRYDYLNLNITPTLNALKSKSTYAKFLLNVFPTQTFTNHFSIATGLYAEDHGVLGSKVYDKNIHKVLSYGYDLWHYSNNVTPIWIINEKAGRGRHSGLMMWPGSDYEYNGLNATFIYIYDTKVPLETRVDKLIEWFIHPLTPANFVMLYIEQPDKFSHVFGPDSEQNRNQIIRTDKIANYLMKNLEKNDLSDVNVIFLSDHGMEGITKNRIIDLTKFVDNEVDVYGTSPVLQIYPRPGIIDSVVYDKLNNASIRNKHFKVYLQKDIPEHFHYKNCKRTPPILVVAEPSYAFQDMYNTIKWAGEEYKVSENGTFGIHGYDPETVEMHPHFIAHGPIFKKNFSAPELRTIDMFSLFCHVLRLEDVKSRGSFDNVQNLFESSGGNIFLSVHVYFISGFVLLLCVISTSFLVYIRKRKHRIRAFAFQENDHLFKGIEFEKLLDDYDKISI